MDEVKTYLKSLGADVVTTDDKLKAALGQLHVKANQVSHEHTAFKEPWCSGCEYFTLSRRHLPCHHSCAYY